MKNYLLLLITVCWGLTTATAQSSATDLSAEEIFDKVLQYYDSEGIWDNYEGTIHLHSIFQNGTGEEYLTINNSTGLYQSVRHLNDSVFVLGNRNGGSFFKINGKEMTADEVPARYQEAPYNLTEHNVKMFQEHHTFHFSPPLILKTSGAELLPQVEKKEIFATECLAIKFSGLPDNYKEGGYNGAITLYINPADSYKLHAMHLDNGWSKDQKGMLNLYSGEIEVNGLKIPGRRLYFHAADNSYNFIDAFQPAEQQNY